MDLIDKLLKLNPNERIGVDSSHTGNPFKEIKDHAFFKDFDFENYRKSPIPLPKSLIALAKKQTVIRKFKRPEDKIVEELKRGLLKKRNEFYMKQTRTFILTSAPSLKYYKN